MSNRVHAEGPRHARLAFIGMAPAYDEVAAGHPFVGASGRLFTQALTKLGIKREDVWIGNVSELLLPPGQSLFTLPKEVLANEVKRLVSELVTLSPNVVIPMGDDPLRILTSLHGITKWRGSILNSTLIPGLKVIPTIHPTWIIRGMWKWEPIFTYIDIKRALEESITKEIKLPPRNCIINPSFNTVIEYIEECSKHDILSVDIEVYGYTATGTGEIACIGIGFRPDEAMCIPFIKSGGIPFYSAQEEIFIWQRFAELLQNPNIKKVGQNLSFEWIYFWLHHIYPSNMWIDTMLLHHTLYPDWGGTEDPLIGKRKEFSEPGHSLAFINSQYTKTPYYKEDGKRWLPGLGDEQFWTYNCYDVMCTLDAALKMYNEVQEEKLWDFYCTYQQKPFLHTARMEWFGVKIDMEKRAQASLELSTEAVSIQSSINELLGYKFNVQSPKQRMELLYKKMKLKPKMKIRKDKFGGIKKTLTADYETLRVFAEQTQEPVLLKIMELGKILDLKADIIDQPLGEDGRMHTHYKQGGTDSNRWSSVKSILGTGMNLQNVPVKGVARCLFIPE